MGSHQKHKDMVLARAKRDPEFRKELLKVALEELVNNPALRKKLQELAEEPE